MFGAAIEDYLKIIYKLSLEAERVTPSAVAEAQGVSAAAVTKMLKRLSELRLARHSRPRGIALTPAGKKVALEMIRHHRLIELYLKEALGYSWDEVDEEAEKLEHVISEEFEERIDRMLGRPTRDPHGAPIPTKEGEVDETRHPPLSDLRVGDTGAVEQVSDRDPELLRYLGEIGLYPGVAVEVVAREPYGGPLQLRVGERVHFVGPEALRHVFVSRTG